MRRTVRPKPQVPNRAELRPLRQAKGAHLRVDTESSMGQQQFASMEHHFFFYNVSIELASRTIN